METQVRAKTGVTEERKRSRISFRDSEESEEEKQMIGGSRPEFFAANPSSEEFEGVSGAETKVTSVATREKKTRAKALHFEVLPERLTDNRFSMIVIFSFLMHLFLNSGNRDEVLIIRTLLLKNIIKGR